MADLRDTRLGPWLDVVLDRRCAGCRGPGPALCRSCSAGLLGPPRAVGPRPAPPHFPPTRAVAVYAGPVREALVAFKDHGRWALRGPLGDALVPSVAALLAETSHVGAVALVPVPGSPGSARLRDGDHVGELAGRAARRLRRLGVDVGVVHAVVAARRRRDQVGLGRVGRAANVAGSMTASARGRGTAPVVLVDDLVTSGATLGEAARALHVVGVRVLGAVVVAATSPGAR